MPVESVSDIQEGVFTLPNESNVKISYKFIANPESNLPVVMLSNSLGANYVTLWTEFVDAFKDQYSILLYDQRFHGKSPLADGEYDYFVRGNRFDQLADDVIALMDHIGISQLRGFVGLSMGANTAILLKAKYPERIGKIVAASGSLRGPKAGEPDVFEPRAEAAMKPDGMLTLAPQTLERWFPGESGKQFLEQNAGRKEDFQTMLNATNKEGFVSCVRALQNFDLTSSLEFIKEHGLQDEVLLVTGSMDGALPKVNEEMAELSGAKHVVLDDSGHIVNVQKVSEFNKLVGDFLQ
ncbi:Alpha/Beta hydrolase protein [Dipodascopsis uninucleata]